MRVSRQSNAVLRTPRGAAQVCCDGPGAERLCSNPESSRLIDFLETPAAYGMTDGSVEVKETHMSWVFLTPGSVFKLKKPLRTPFLDYSTLAAREKFCKEEVRLNRRLAARVYLGAPPVVREKTGKFSIGGEGDIVDWLVEMRRLPRERMLDRALKTGTAARSDVCRALSLLFRFFSTAPPVSLERGRYMTILRRQQAETVAVLDDRRFDLPRRAIAETLAALQSVLDREPDWLLEPLAQRRIIEGHGDLRPEHICLTEPPAIIDCLEFNRDLRLLDPFDELSYLALECRLLGAAGLADEIVTRYASFSASAPPPILLDFYTAYRGAIRARLAIAHVFDWPRRHIARWTEQAAGYLNAAHAASLNMRRREGP